MCKTFYQTNHATAETFDSYLLGLMIYEAPPSHLNIIPAASIKPRKIRKKLLRKLWIRGMIQIEASQQSLPGRGEAGGIKTLPAVTNFVKIGTNKWIVGAKSNGSKKKFSSRAGFREKIGCRCRVSCVF